MSEIVLASQSPRRAELLRALVPEFTVQPSDVEEFEDGDPATLAERLAREKASAVSAERPGVTIIGADTVVAMNGQTFAKPADVEGARAMLRTLRGRRHTVYTGVAVARDGDIKSATAASHVEMAELPDEAIDRYVASGRPFDKAGAYAIQDEDVPTVRTLEGCYCSVMGLPLWTLRRLLLDAGHDAALPDATYARCSTCPERPAEQVG